MAKYTPKSARERAEKFENSWQENSPEKQWADGTLANFKTKRAAIAEVESELETVAARQDALQIKRDNLNTEMMKECDYIAADVESDRNFGKDSALYGGFGYIRESEKKRPVRKSKQPISG